MERLGLWGPFSAFKVYMMLFLPSKDTFPHQDRACTAPQRHTVAGIAAPITTDTGNTFPQRANPTQTKSLYSVLLVLTLHVLSYYTA